jgi:hypothetical protein
LTELADVNVWLPLREETPDLWKLVTAQLVSVAATVDSSLAELPALAALASIREQHLIFAKIETWNV